MKNATHPSVFLCGAELKVILRFRQGMDTWQIARELKLGGGEPEAARLLASAREKTRAAK